MLYQLSIQELGKISHKALHHYLYRTIIDRADISHNEKIGVFTVLGTTGTPHTMPLFPKQSCSCLSTGIYNHIITAQISISIEVAQLKINSSKLKDQKGQDIRMQETSSRRY